MKNSESSQLTFHYSDAPTPLVVCYGAGRDSTAMLVGFWQRSVRPELILFADVGAERQSTYDYLPIVNQWLDSVRFPEIAVVRYQAKDFKHWPPYHIIEENTGQLSSSFDRLWLSQMFSKMEDCPATGISRKVATGSRLLGRWRKIRKAIGFDSSRH